MPEGDTIHRAAARLRPALVDQPLIEASSPLPALSDMQLVGRHVTEVEARGKNLLIWFDDGRALYTHMRMSGRWRIQPTGDEPPTGDVRVSLANAQWRAVCFSAPTVELLTERGVARHPVLGNLGPDLLAPTLELAAAVARLRSDPARPLGEAVMDQRLVSGIGNVYKSELLFMAGLDPFGAVGDVAPEALEAPLLNAGKWMRRNLGPGRRRTRWGAGGPDAWVYGRSGEGCLKCGGRVLMRRQGRLGRSTYYCGGCQGVDEAQR